MSQLKISSKPAARIIILTGSELRHRYFRTRLAQFPGLAVMRTYCEGLEKSHSALVKNSIGPKTMRENHLVAREQSEHDFFADYVDAVADKSKPVAIVKGAINDDDVVDEIFAAQPDILVAYGCSLIKTRLLDEFAGRFLNVHLGLSPYYRGSGTNFWPLVNNQPEFVGATFMHIDPGIDTGAIIHQIRARYAWGDTPSAVGNRLIADMIPVYAELIARLGGLSAPPEHIGPGRQNIRNDKVYRAKDFSEEAVIKLYQNFDRGIIADYLENAERRKANAPIIRHPELVGVESEGLR